MQTGGAKIQTTNLPISNNFLEFLQKLSFFNNNNNNKKSLTGYWLLHHKKRVAKHQQHSSRLKKPNNVQYEMPAKLAK